MAGAFLRKAEVYVKNKGVIYLIGIFVITLAAIGCDDDCPTCPDCNEEVVYQGRVYVTMNFGPPSIVVFDAATDSVLDSLTIDPNRSYGTAQVTPDGKYLLVGNDLAQTLIFDAATLTQIGQIGGAGLTTLVRDGTALFCAHAGHLTLYSIPEAELILDGLLEHQSFGRLHYDSGSDLVYGIATPIDLYSNSDTTDIVFIELDSLTERRRFRVTDEDGQYYLIRRVYLNFASGVGYALGEYNGEYYLQFDAETGKIQHRFPLYLTFGDLELSPDGSEVLVCDPGDPFVRLNPGTIYIFDAATGEYTGGISVVGLLPDSPGEPLDVWRLQFSPDGSTLYAATGHLLTRLGTVLKFDPKKRRFLNILFPKIDRLPYDMAIGPIP